MKPLFVLALLSTAFAFAAGPLADLGLRDRQPYASAKKALAKLGYAPGKVTDPLEGAKPDLRHPEIVCGKMPNDFTGRTECLATYTNAKSGQSVTLNLKHDLKGRWILNGL